MKTHVINSQLICPEYDREYPMMECGKGVYLYDRHGKAYIDGSGCTAAVTHIGHGVNTTCSFLDDIRKVLFSTLILHGSDNRHRGRRRGCSFPALPGELRSPALK